MAIDRYTTGDFIVKLRRKMGDETATAIEDGDIWTAGHIIDALNMGLARMSRDLLTPYRETSFNTIATQRAYTFGTEILSTDTPAVNDILLVFGEYLYCGTNNLERIYKKDLQYLLRCGEEAGEPQIFAEEQDKIYFYPIPATVKAIKLPYVAYPAMMSVSALTAVPSIKLEHQEVLIAYAAHTLYEDSGRGDMSANELSKYNYTIMKARADINRKRYAYADRQGYELLSE